MISLNQPKCSISVNRHILRLLIEMNYREMLISNVVIIREQELS